MKKINQLLAIAIVLVMSPIMALAQSAQKKTSGPQMQAANSPVTGSGTAGQLPKWTGAPGTSILGDSGITEDKFGNIGIGTTVPTSKLTVFGMIQTTLGGLKFPDGTVQTTALAAGQVVSSLNNLKGNVTLAAGPNISITPSGNTLTISAAGALTAIAHDVTLVGAGTSAQPLGIAAPLFLSASDLFTPTLKVENPVNGLAFFAAGGAVIRGRDAHEQGLGGSGALVLIAGNADHGNGGDSMSTRGGDSMDNGGGGQGLSAAGGRATGAGFEGGAGIVASGGPGFNGAKNGPAAVLNGDVEIRNTGHLTVSGFVQFDGNANIDGILTVFSGLNVVNSKHFKIDHPLDPENKYLYHASIESSEVLNLYSGNITTNQQGEAVVQLPDWFEALNRDFRYQLTVIGSFAQAIVGSEIKGNRFTIKTNAAGVKVSWQVTGVRSDAEMRKHPFKVEEDKPETERGYYLSPDAYNQPEARRITSGRPAEPMRQAQEGREKTQPQRPQ